MPRGVQPFPRGGVPRFAPVGPPRRRPTGVPLRPRHRRSQQSGRSYHHYSRREKSARTRSRRRGARQPSRKKKTGKMMSPDPEGSSDLGLRLRLRRTDDQFPEQERSECPYRRVRVRSRDGRECRRLWRRARNCANLPAFRRDEPRKITARARNKMITIGTSQQWEARAPSRAPRRGARLRLSPREHMHLIPSPSRPPRPRASHPRRLNPPRRRHRRRTRDGPRSPRDMPESSIASTRSRRGRFQHPRVTLESPLPTPAATTRATPRGTS